MSPPFENFWLSPLGLVPKKEAGCFRLIHHLFYPLKYSLNDDVDNTLASVEYASLSLSQPFGLGVLLAKVDIKSAFRLLPVCESGFNSLGFQCHGCFHFVYYLLFIIIFLFFTLKCFPPLLNGL